MVSGLSRLPWLPVGWVARRSAVSGVCAGLCGCTGGVPAPALRCLLFFFFFSRGLKPPRHDGEARHKGARATNAERERDEKEAFFERSLGLKGGGSERRAPRPPGPRPPWVARGYVTRAVVPFFFPLRCLPFPLAFPEGKADRREAGESRWPVGMVGGAFSHARKGSVGPGAWPAVASSRRGPVPMLSR